jgi:hypothetical protein
LQGEIVESTSIDVDNTIFRYQRIKKECLMAEQRTYVRRPSIKRFFSSLNFYFWSSREVVECALIKKKRSFAALAEILSKKKRTTEERKKKKNA